MILRHILFFLKQMQSFLTNYVIYAHYTFLKDGREMRLKLFEIEQLTKRLSSLILLHPLKCNMHKSMAKCTSIYNFSDCKSDVKIQKWSTINWRFEVWLNMTLHLMVLFYKVIFNHYVKMYDFNFVFV